MSIKISNDTVGNRTRDLPTCSALLNGWSPILRQEYRLGVPRYRHLRTVCVSEGGEDTESGKNLTQGLLLSK